MNIRLPEVIRRHVAGLPCDTDDVGMSGAKVLLYPDCVLKIRPDNALALRERSLLDWLDGRVPAPRIIASVQEDGQDYLLMTRIHGRMLCEAEFLDNPARLCGLLAEGMRLLHTADASGCPVDRSLDVVLAEASERVGKGLCTFEGCEGFSSPGQLLEYLLRNRPDETLTLTHGDYCLPNVLADDHGVCGLIDLGDGGLADPYMDIALGYQSLVRNMTGFFGGPVRTMPDKRLLFDCLGVTPDWDKLDYYLLLDKLFG